MTKEQREKIKNKCPKCAYGAFDGAISDEYILCSHWSIVINVGKNGAEWAATCTHFEDTGKIGRWVKRLERSES